MAEFKLGRIRFVWQGDWNADRAYVADDVVSFGGKSYICVRNHTSSEAFNIDFDNEIPKWEIVSDGTSWQGEWEPGYEYAPGDVVKYGALVYICEIGHTSATFEAPDFLGLEEDLENWTPFATSFDWKGDWTTSNRYKINDLVKYGSYVYLCNVAHISASTQELGLEADQGKWELFSSGLIYLGDWVTGNRYRINDVVKYGGNVFICVVPHTSGDFLTDEANWDVFIEGFQFEDSWNNSTVYQIGDTVTYGGYVYVAKNNNSNSQPTTNPADWEVFTTGFKFQGDWDSQNDYRVGDVVRLGGSTYVAVADNTDTTPPDESAWSRLNSGINWTRSTETFSQVSGTNVTGSGSGARFDIVKSNTVYTVNVSTGFAGTGYAENDVILVTGDLVGGASPANDLTITVTAETAGVIDSISQTGFSSTWIPGENYYVGDVVIFGASSFISVTTHLSDNSNRPDNDSEAEFWNLLTLGSEALSLSVDGDMVYYGNNGPTRLPIGVDGQILRASDGLPDWANYGLVDNVVYVGPLGSNSPAPESGLTIDKPWQSLRYALDQVRDGYLNPLTKQVLRNNKQFIIKELTSWIDVNYRVIISSSDSGSRTFTANRTDSLSEGMPIEFNGTIGGVVAGQIYYVESITSSTEFRVSETPDGLSFELTDDEGIMEGNLSYNSDTCERDTALIVDALVYDISRGGTLDTTNAAKAYYNRAGNLYATSSLTNQRVVNVEAFTKMKEIVNYVLQNKTPVNFQSLNNIEITEQAQQVIDFDYVPESNGVSKSQELMDIVIVGVGAESNTAIALPKLPNTTVFIKTGTYNEVLPMILPEYTAVVGDELRTSVVQPQPAIDELETDKPKALTALDRVKEIASDLLQNVEIEKTSGNSLEQEYLNDYAGNTTSTNRLNNGVEQITDVLANGTDEVPTQPEIGPTPTGGSTNASDAGFANAVNQINANYEFIKEELIAWTNVQIEGNTAPFTDTFTYDVEVWEKDTRTILDAVRYDLTYGGNLETIVAARAYFVDGSPVYAAGEKEERLAAYTRLKNIVSAIIVEDPVTPSAGNDLLQDISGTAGSTTAQTFAEARIQEIFDTIDTDGTLPVRIEPDISWIESPLLATYNEVNSSIEDIKQSVIDHINSTYGPRYKYDSAKFRKDLELLVDSSGYDTAIETNFNAVRDGKEFRRTLTPEQIENDLFEITGALTQAKSLTQALMSDPTAITRNNAYWDEVIGIIENGIDTADTISFGSHPDGDKNTARTELQTNKASIIADVISWIDSNYPSTSYEQWTIERDFGRFIDALSYDVNYGGNSATIEEILTYFEGYAGIRLDSQRSLVADAFDQLKTIVLDYMSGATQEAEVSSLIDIMVLTLRSDSKVAIPTKTYPDITYVGGDIQSDSEAVISDTSVVLDTLQFITNNYTGFVYNQTKCSRDIGYIVDALQYDMLFGSKFRSLKAGMAYRRGITSTQFVIDQQLEATIGSVEETRLEIKEITTKTVAVSNRVEEITDILVNSTVPSSYVISDPTDYDTGFFNARRLIVANKQFLIDEAEAFLDTNYTAIWSGLTTAEQDSWLSDIESIIEALRYDLTYRGNLETIVRARYYYFDGVFVRPENQKTASIALKTRLADIISDVATGVAITPSAGNITTQDVSGTAGSNGAAAFAEDRINEIKNTIETEIIPAVINPSLNWVDSSLVKFKNSIDSRIEIIKQGAIDFINYLYPTLVYDESLCARDVGYIVDAIVYDVIFGSNFRTAQAGLAYNRGTSSTETVINNQLGPTVKTIEYIEEQLVTITTSVVSTPGTRKTGDRAYKLIKDMNTVVQNQLEALPPTVFPTAPYYNTADFANLAYATTSNTEGFTTTYGDAVDQIVNNYSFIQEEIAAWLNDPTNGYDTVWSDLGAEGQARFIRNVGYILDAVRYDTTYGGNTQSLIVGSEYYDNFVLIIPSEELPATLAAYARLREVVSEVVAETAVTTSPGVTLSQDTSGESGNAASIEFVRARIDDVLDWINTGFSNDEIEIATNWQTLEITKAYNRVRNRKSEIVEDVVYWVEKFHQELIYNQNDFRVKVRSMVDALARDLFTESNFATIKEGKRYYRIDSNAEEFVDNQQYAIVGSIEFFAQKARYVATIPANAFVDILIDDVKNYIDGGFTPIPKWVAPSNADQNNIAAASIIWENKQYIQEEVYTYLTENYPNNSYTESEFKQDIGEVVDALRYDLTYNSESAIISKYEEYFDGDPQEGAPLEIDPGDVQATVDSYDYMKQIVSGLASNSVSSPGSLQENIEPVLRDDTQLVGDSNSIEKVESLMTTLYNLLNGITADNLTIRIDSITSNIFNTGSPHNLEVGHIINIPGDIGEITTGEYYVKSIESATEFTLSSYFDGPTISTPDEADTDQQVEVVRTASVSAVSNILKQQFTNITGSLSTIKQSITEFLAENYPTLDYDIARSERDVEYIVEAVGRDMMVESNYLTNIAATAYYRGTQAEIVLGEQKNATVQAYRELKNVLVSFLTTQGNGDFGNSEVLTARNRINRLMDIIIKKIDQGNGSTPEIHGTVKYYGDRERINAVDILKANRTFVAAEAIAFIKSQYGGTVNQISGVPSRFIFDSDHNLVVNDPIVFDEDIFGGVESDKVYYVSNVTSEFELEISEKKGGDSLNFEASTGSSVASYGLNESRYYTDFERYVDSIAYDIQYPGNNKSWKSAQIYLNAVQGSERSDMYHVRNGTGVRNQTVNGLRGNLSEENDFGTRRPTAGAYVSLDPGFGPTDTKSWVTNKSCYVQNVSTFGVGCVGCKIDGALHAGGNRSIVSNDFTQILSDGIGVWCSGNNSLTELVSVFAYYNYAGYLADFGGRIRATNGNSSYGTFGVIAEGTDTGEETIDCQVNNLAQEALIYSVLTDGAEEVLAFEYSNAGRDYTNLEYAISGSGFNARAIGDEFRDQSVVETRIIDLDDGATVGGEDYVIAQNVAQGGDQLTLQLAATDFALSNAYLGMNAQLTAGTGVGQYATILTYNNGSKVAKVYKDSFDPLTVTSTSATGNVLNVASTLTLYIDMPIYLEEDIGGLTAATAYYITSIVDDTTFTVSDEEAGTDVTLSNETKNVTLYAAGWDHVISGTPIASELDLTTGYTVEPKIKYTSPGFDVDDSLTSATSTGFASMIYANDRYIALDSNGTTTNYSLDGVNWENGGILPESGDWSAVTFGGGSGATATAIIGGLGGQGAVLEAELGELNNIGLPGPTQISRINVIDGGRGYLTAPTITITPTNGGGGARAVAVVKDGSIQEIIITSTGAGFATAPTVEAETDKLTEVIVDTKGRGYLNPPTVTISGGGASSQAEVTATISNNGVNTITIDEDEEGDLIRGSGYTSTPTVTIIDENAKWVAISEGSTDNANLSVIDEANTNWSAGSPLPSSVYIDIAYGDGVYVVVGGAGGSGSAATSTDGSSWVSRDNINLSIGSFTALAYGNTRFVAISDQGETAYSSNGITWIQGGDLPGSSISWKDLSYGNGRFVAIASDGSYAISYDVGENWYSVGTTLNNINPAGWQGVEYGQGLFLASCAGSDWATSPDGINWTPHLTAGTSSYTAFAFGNPNNLSTWSAVTADTGNGAAVINTGATPLGRAYAEDGVITQISLREPGSGYPVGTVLSTTAPNTLELEHTKNLFVGQPISFENPAQIGLDSETLYYVSDISGNNIEVSLISGGASFAVNTVPSAEISLITFAAGPQVTITDPSATVDAAVNPRIRNGVLGQPTFTNRGTGYTSATAELGGDGSADLYQPSTFIAVKGLFELPEPGSNVEFANIPGSYYKLVTISSVIGQPGDFTATFQISPGLTVLNAPKDGTEIKTTYKYSQTRLTGHDFLYIGTGNQAQTNYPFVDITTASIDAQQLSSGGGRVFFTSTDQDGNFNVGGLFGVQQSTGTATLDADAFNLAGLQSLQLGGISVGIGSAIITQFSTDPFFTENSDNIVPTQRAIRSYIEAQIGGGQSSLNVNTLTAGTVFIANDEITTTSGGQLNIKAKMNFTGGIDGAPVALGFFLSR